MEKKYIYSCTFWKLQIIHSDNAIINQFNSMWLLDQAFDI